MWVEVILIYAIVTSCTQAGRCEPGSHQVAIDSEVLGKPFATEADCVKRVRHDIQLLVENKPIPEYGKTPTFIGGYRVFLKPICSPTR